MRRLAVIIAAALVVGACAEASVETSQMSGGTLLPSVEGSTASTLEALATDICAQNAWTGLPEATVFEAEAADLGITEDLIASAVRRRCPDTLYVSLSRAEVDWCGNGSNFGQNFFRVVEAGVDLGIESFTIVEPALISKATSRSAELSDYEVELLTAELQTMSESSRFERDWAEACRSTF
jgi:hypothetical protein